MVFVVSICMVLGRVGWGLDRGYGLGSRCLGC